MLEEHSNVSLDQLQQALEKRLARVVTVGKIGLDLLGDDLQFKRQQWLLDEQLKLAKRYDLPAILHSQHTHDKLTMHLERRDLPCIGMVHGFSGSLQQAEWFVQLDYKISVGGAIIYLRVGKTCGVVVKLPPASLLLGADAPDMPFNGFQGQPNRPEQAARVFAMLCELRPEPTDEIAEVLLNNTYTLFNVSQAGQDVYAASGHWRVMPGAALARLVMPTSLCQTVGRIRRSRRIRQLAHNTWCEA